MSAVFEVSPETAVIGLCTVDNLIHVYEDRRIEVAKVDDLIRVIRQSGPIGTPTREKVAGRAA